MAGELYPEGDLRYGDLLGFLSALTADDAALLAADDALLSRGGEGGGGEGGGGEGGGGEGGGGGNGSGAPTAALSSSSSKYFRGACPADDAALPAAARRWLIRLQP